jgi:hypothetical protein
MDFTELRDAVGLVKAREDDVVIAMAAHRDATAMAMACAEETLLYYQMGPLLQMSDLNWYTTNEKVAVHLCLLIQLILY